MNLPLQARFGIGLDACQARLVREGLVELPWHAVHGLVDRLDAWAADRCGLGGGAPFGLDAAELALVMEALAGLPYRRVHGLIASLRQQLAGSRRSVGAPA